MYIQMKSNIIAKPKKKYCSNSDGEELLKPRFSPKKLKASARPKTEK